ncbi:MFS transporter [Jatrophihabitans lederbergiae]|uniref:MFS transporter n=1 Tax=Jatrophihabitans lederbergiae TaxID=3075547 RepID=A0ABU2JFT9_9ACTN|nr:MFS transporter [Jatrophihabitans sp. DSM 44399]MDT0263840.1 MFS transporter [Jatrophihabitans sp. DSM 44399]
MATEPDIGARLDRAPWQRLHTTILIALGAGWLFDSFEVQMFSSAVGPLGDHFGASVFERDAVLAVWLGGILIGAVVGGSLADRFGRRRLFVATLLWYAGFTVLTGLSPNLAFVYGFRFLGALGVGAEYSIVNAAISEFMPVRVRGKANALVMNFWPLGAILAGLLAYFALDTLALSSAVSWRYMFVLGGLVALVVLFFRRRIPESARWLASQGRTGEAEQIVQTLEGVQAPSVPLADETSRPVTALSTRSALAELLRHYPGRLALGSLLDLAEAFGYYGLFALMSVVVLPQIHISQSGIPIFYIIGNVGALAGGVLMASLFDRVGHRRTVGTCYLLSAVAVAVLAIATQSGSTLWVTLAFVVANGVGTAAWTSAYPMFTELFPTHLRGMGVGTSVAVGRIGAIVGTLALPTIASDLGATASYSLVAAFWLVGAIAVGVAALNGGPDPSRRSLEDVAPLRAEPVLL